MSSTPTVTVPIQVNAEPVKVKFASPSNSVVVEPIVVNRLADWLFKAVIVPAIALPVSLIASFLGIYLFGLSIK